MKIEGDVKVVCPKSGEASLHQMGWEKSSDESEELIFLAMALFSVCVAFPAFVAASTGAVCALVCLYERLHGVGTIVAVGS